MFKPQVNYLIASRSQLHLMKFITFEFPSVKITQLTNNDNFV
jgi:hypothetical protein